MSVKISYLNKSIGALSGNVILFVNEKFSTKNLNNYLKKTELTYINELLRTSDLKKNIFVYELNSKRKIILISIKSNLKTFEIENLGAELFARVNYGKNSEYSVVSDSMPKRQDDFIGYFLHGLNLNPILLKNTNQKKMNAQYQYL